MQFHVPPDVAIDKVVKGVYSALAFLTDRASLSKSIEVINVRKPDFSSFLKYVSVNTYSNSYFTIQQSRKNVSLTENVTIYGECLNVSLWYLQ